MKNMKVLGYLLIATTLFIACKNNEKTSSSAEQKTEYSNNHEDSLFFFMKKTACLGQCPVYDLEIKHSGEASINARHFLPFEGKFNSSFSQPELDSIKSLIQACDYFNLEKSYDSPITDVPSTITEIHLDDKSNRVKNRYKGPKALSSLQIYIHGLVMEKTWK